MHARSATLGALKQIDAGVLNIGYVDTGPANGPPVILLHGWPYDVHAFIDVAPVLAAEGYRAIVPYLRGYGTTEMQTAHRMRPVRPMRRNSQADTRTD